MAPNRYYLIQVWGRDGGGPGDRFINFNICVNRAPNHCGNLALTNVCNYPFSTAPSVTWVTSNCSSIPQNPPADGGSDLQYCFSFVATNTFVNLGAVVNSTCMGGNVTYANWTLYSTMCNRISGPTDLLSNPTVTGLTPGTTYIVCYRYGVPLGCAHSALYPYTYVTPLPVTLVDYRAFCRPEGVELSWAFGAERDMIAYRVERQLPGHAKAEPIGEVPTQGGLGLKLYNLVDPSGLAPAGTLYRLSEVSPDGAVVEIATVEISSTCGQPRLSLIETASGTLLSLAAKESGWCSWVAYDITGRQLSEGGEYLSAGIHVVPIEVGRGAYVLVVQLPDGTVQTLRGLR